MEEGEGWVPAGYFLVPTEDGRRVFLPIGFAFEPEDHELIADYLDRFLSGRPLSSACVRPDDVYRTEPWNLLRDGEQEAFFFTPRTFNAQRSVNRTAGCGKWKAQSGEAVHHKDGGPIIGRKELLSFCFKGKGSTTGWVMHEYLLGSDSQEAKKQTNALCRIIRKAGAVTVPPVQRDAQAASTKKKRPANDPSTSHASVRRRLDCSLAAAEAHINSTSRVAEAACGAGDPSTSRATPCPQVLHHSTAAAEEAWVDGPNCIESAAPPDHLLPVHCISEQGSWTMTESAQDFCHVAGYDEPVIDHALFFADDMPRILQQQNAETSNPTPALPEECKPDQALHAIGPTTEETTHIGDLGDQAMPHLDDGISFKQPEAVGSVQNTAILPFQQTTCPAHQDLLLDLATLPDGAPLDKWLDDFAHSLEAVIEPSLTEHSFREDQGDIPAMPIR